MELLETVTVLLRLSLYIAYCYLIEIVHLFKPPSKKSIAGEIVLVTGAGNGIGRQLAIELSKLGTTMVCWDVSKENNEKTAKEINESGGKAFAYVCNVADSAQIASVAENVRKEVGEVSILVNNAGVLNGRYLMDLEEKDIRRLFDVNILSHFWMAKEFLPHMKEKNHGHIFNVSSMSAFSGIPTMIDYSSSKAAALNLSEGLGMELKELGYNGIHVSALCPMFADTEMVKKFQYKCPIPTLTTEEVAKVAVDGLLKNYDVITVPRSMWYSNKITQCLPRKVLEKGHMFGFLKVSPLGKKDN